MGFVSHRVNRVDLKAGDHIYTWRTPVFAYSHHGLFLHLLLSSAILFYLFIDECVYTFRIYIFVSASNAFLVIFCLPHLNGRMFESLDESSRTNIQSDDYSNADS